MLKCWQLNLPRRERTLHRPSHSTPLMIGLIPLSAARRGRRKQLKDSWKSNKSKHVVFQCREINSAACKIAKDVSKEYGTIVAGGITQTETYLETKNKAKVQAELTKALEVLIENDVDLIIIEYFFYIQVSTH